MPTNKNEYILFLQSFGVTLVVFNHSFAIYPTPFIIKWVSAWISSYYMPLFFFISGYLFVYTNPQVEMIEIKSFIFKKVNRIIVPYLILTLIAFIPKFILSEYAYNKIDLNISSFVSGFVYPATNPVAYFWFLPTIFIIYCIALYLYRYIYQVSCTYYTLIFFGLFLLNLFNPFNSVKLFNINNVSFYLIFFWLGSMYFLSEKLVDKYLENSLSLPFLLLITIILTHLFYGTGKGYLIKAIFGIFMSVALSKIYINRNYSFFKFINGFYYQIYLLSWFFITFCRIFLYHTIGLSPYITYAAMFFSGLFLPIYIAKFIDSRANSIKFAIGM